MQAVEANKSDSVRALLAAHANPNKTDNDGESALYHAAYQGLTDIVKDLVTVHADVNRGESALLVATFWNHVSVVKALISAGANVNRKDADGCTPLIIAADRGSSECVKLLIAAHADLNLEDNKGRTAMSAANQNPERNSPKHQAAVVNLLRAAGANE